jgi:ATP-binding cassette subfamily B protein
LRLPRLPRRAAERGGTLYRGLRLVVSAAPAGVCAYAALALAGGVVAPAQVWLTKTVVDGLSIDPTPAVLVAAVAYLLTFVVASALAPVEQTLSGWLEERAIAAADRELVRAGHRLADLCRIERPAFGDELRLAERAAFYLTGVLGWGGRLANAALSLGGTAILLGRLHPLLPPVLAALAIPHLLVERRTVQLLYEYMTTYSRAAREMDYCVQVTTQVDAAKEIRVFGLGDFFLRRYERLRERALREVDGVRLRQLCQSTGLMGLYAGALGAGLWYVAAQAAGGRLTVGDVALYVAAIAHAQSAFGRVTAVARLYETQRHLAAFFGFLDRARPGVALPPPGEARPAPARLTGGIELCDVGFAYPDGAPVLRDVSVTLRAGTVTALVGANGAGKSTLVKLLTRMYDPASGEILLDGRPLAAYDLDSLRARIGVAYQDFARFSLSLRDNIAVGAASPDGGRRTNDESERPRGEDSSSVLRPPSSVEAAARWAGADEVAAALPDGYDTELTRRFEGGVDLSGGQWQKVALARGFMRDAALVILDEPTAALDADAEYHLFQRFRALVAGKTALLISHRFSTVRMTDHILVLEGGRIVEAGSHDELLKSGGRYATLFELQAGRYRS